MSHDLKETRQIFWLLALGFSWWLILSKYTADPMVLAASGRSAVNGAVALI